MELKDEVKSNENNDNSVPLTNSSATTQVNQNSVKKLGRLKRFYNWLIGSPLWFVGFQFVLFIVGALSSQVAQDIYHSWNDSAAAKGHGIILLFLILVGLIIIFISYITVSISQAIKDAKKLTNDSINDIEIKVVAKSQSIENLIKGEVKKTHGDTKEVLENIEKNFDETLKDIKHKVDKLGKQPIHTEYVLTDDKGYQESLNRIRDAEKEILIIGDYSPQNFSLKETDKRNDYFVEIEKKIEQAITDESIRNFKYTRIIVRDNIINSRNNGGKLELRKTDMEGDEQSFIHLCRVKKNHQEKTRPGDGVDINFKVSKPIPNLPSILLIDGKYMLITVPFIEQSDFSHFITDGVLYFTFEIDDIDEGIRLKAKKSVARFQSIFDKVSNNADRVIINTDGVELD